MSTAILIFRQLCIMFLYLLIGFILYRRRIITAVVSKELASLLVHLIIPAVIVKSFCVERTGDTIVLLGVSALVGALLLALSVVCAALLSIVSLPLIVLLGGYVFSKARGRHIPGYLDAPPVAFTGGLRCGAHAKNLK